MTRRAVRESRGKEGVRPRRLDISFLEDMMAAGAYNREILRNSEYLCHAPISPQPRADPKYQVQLHISSPLPQLGKTAYREQQV